MTQPVPTPPTVQIEAHAAALLPWLEANQGLISVIALIAALTIAIFEFMRANRIEERRDTDFRKAVRGLIDQVVEKIEEGMVHARIDGDVIVAQTMRAPFIAQAGLTERALTDVARAAPANAELLLLLAQIRRDLDIVLFGLGYDANATARHLTERKASLLAHRAKLDTIPR